MSRRIVGYDIARAVAVFGMVVVNFKVAMGADRSGPGWLVGLTGLLDGRAAATFVVLAGAGLSLFARDRDRLPSHRRTLFRRALFLFVVGLLYTPLWPADILHFYGVYIAAGALLLAAPTRWLWIGAALLVVAFAAMLFVFDYDRGWDWSTLAYEGIWTPDGMLRHLFFNGFHPVVPWLAFLLVGMALGRLEMEHASVRRRVLRWGVGAALVVEVASRVLVRVSTGHADPEEIVAVFGTQPMPPMPLYMIAGAGTACAVIAVCIEVGARWDERLRVLVATGQLALTLYVAHVVVGMGTLELLGRLEGQTLAVALLAAGVFCVLGSVFAYLWHRRFRRGPLEALMRAVTG